MKEPATSRPSSDRGYSLVELLLVVAIIAIMAAVALPLISNYLRVYKIRGATQEFAKEIQAARGKAISKNVNFGVVLLIVSDSSYRWVSEDDLNAPDAEFTFNVRVPLNTNTAITDPASTPGVASQRGPISFLPRGIVFTQGCSLPGPWERGMRFNRLGGWCAPTPGEPCPPIPVGAQFVSWTSAGGATVCVSQPDTGLTRTVSVAPGGRVLTPQ
jgi:prepilin-type N-terminal cleavage/methylation domain-containing protein